MKNALACSALLITALLGCDRNRTADVPPGPTYLQPESGDDRAIYVAPAGPDEPIERVEAERDERRAEYAVDAMIGQINGRPMYASQIFEQVGTDTLQTLGQQFPRNEFRKQATVLLGQTLSQMVQDALILAEAEAGLTEQEQRGLFGALQKIREDIISTYRGVESEAEADLADVGGIEGKLELERQKLLVQKYRAEKVFPGISVNRREVERYYQKNRDKYNPPASIKLALVVARDKSTADAVRAALSRSTFAEAGKVEAARYLEQEFQSDLAEFEGLRSDEVNQKVRRLEIGQHTDATRTAAGMMWVKLLDIEQGEGKTLTEVYREIENQIRIQKFNQINREHVMELMKKGNYTPVENMLVVLMDVAMNRYAQVE